MIVGQKIGQIKNRTAKYNSSLCFYLQPKLLAVKYNTPSGLMANTNDPAMLPFKRNMTLPGSPVGDGMVVTMMSDLKSKTRMHASIKFCAISLSIATKPHNDRM